MTRARTLVEGIRSSLRTAGDADRAIAQRAYMKSAMPFYGIPVPQVRAIARVAAKGETDAATLVIAALALWDEASHREERYAALAILGRPVLRGDERLVAPIEHMVRTGRWWDFTDELAHRVADLLDADPAGTGALVRGWARDDDFWMRRIAIISQLGRGIRLDRELLADVIAPNLDDPEFFIRKAIGWALREYARVDADWVRAFAASHALSPLSSREALKHIGP